MQEKMIEVDPRGPAFYGLDTKRTLHYVEWLLLIDSMREGPSIDVSPVLVACCATNTRSRAISCHSLLSKMTAWH